VLHANVSDVAGNPAANPTGAGAQFRIDNVAPGFSSVTSPPGASTTVTVTFTENVYSANDGTGAIVKNDLDIHEQADTNNPTSGNWSVSHTAGTNQLTIPVTWNPDLHLNDWIDVLPSGANKIFDRAGNAMPVTTGSGQAKRISIHLPNAPAISVRNAASSLFPVGTRDLSTIGSAGTPNASPTSVTRLVAPLPTGRGADWKVSLRSEAMRDLFHRPIDARVRPGSLKSAATTPVAPARVVFAATSNASEQAGSGSAPMPRTAIISSAAVAAASSRASPATLPIPEMTATLREKQAPPPPWWLWMLAAFAPAALIAGGWRWAPLRCYKGKESEDA
jgi:hypothetical protein